MDGQRPSIVLYPHKGIAALGTVGGFGMVAAFVAAYSIGDARGSAAAQNINLGMAVLATLFFGLIGIAEEMMLFSTGPILVVDGRGISITAGLWNFGLITWDEIGVLTTSRIRTVRFLSIGLRDVRPILARQPLMPKIVLWLNSQPFAPSIYIPQVWIRMSADDLLQRISKEFAAEIRQHGIGTWPPRRKRARRPPRKATSPRA